jgi:glycine oxidase
MLRLLHPRYPVYIAPRAEGRLVVGATSIESDDHSTVSVRGALELLTSAYSVLPALAEARILEFSTQVRPALPDNVPALRFDRKQGAVHQWASSSWVEEALALLSLQEPSPAVGRWPCLREDHSVTFFAEV